MNCSDFERVVFVLANDRLIEVGRRAEALRHMENCAQCAARLGAECTLVSGVRAVRAELANEQASAHLETVLLNAFRERAGRAVIDPMPQKTRSWVNRNVAAVAAVILLVTSIGAIVFVRSISPGETSTASIPPVTIRDLTAETPTHDLSKITQPRTPRRPPIHRVNRPETATEYFPLMEGEDLDAVEFAQVVRVELSASALREVGLPLSYSSDGEPVKADIVLGQDGVARAIRFVR